MFSAFHFLRPLWFLALIPAIIVFIFALKWAKSGNDVWNKHCDQHLLEHLLSRSNQISRTSLPYLLFGLWLVAIVALAGPTWSRYAQNVYQKNIARVIALDVSQSMNTSDIAPSRLERGKYKTLDLLHNIKEGQTGMVVFSSAAFVVSPLTSDSNTIASMVPILDSTIVPVQGSDISTALSKSANLIKQAGFTDGEIILITDSTPSDNAIVLAQRLAKEGYTISVLGIGTKQGGPVSNANGSLVMDKNGNVTVAKLDSTALEKLAKNGNGKYIAFSNSNLDITQLLEKTNFNLQNPSKKMETKSLWKDEGHYLVWLLILLSAFIARRGWLEKIC